MSMTIYHGEPNGPSFTVLAALFEKGLDAERVRIRLEAGERHALACAREAEVAMSVEGEGPVLVVDGEGMSDSVFIGCYLDDVGQGTALRPADPYARWATMTWCRQLIERTAPAAAYLGCKAYPPKVDAATLNTMTSVDLRARWEDATAGRYADAKLEDSKLKITQAVQKLETQLEKREWLMDSFSLADLESYAWLAGMAQLVPSAFAGAARTASWLERVKKRPGVARALAQASVVDPRKCWAPGPEINRWG
jgi:GSH-dependent disulfide-bond oxidoreductase